jgi:hypothetical protein
MVNGRPERRNGELLGFLTLLSYNFLRFIIELVPEREGGN